MKNYTESELYSMIKDHIEKEFGDKILKSFYKRISEFVKEYNPKLKTVLHAKMCIDNPDEIFSLELIQCACLLNRVHARA